MDKLHEAFEFCKARHSGQVRKYTSEEYFTHPLAVRGHTRKYKR